MDFASSGRVSNKMLELLSLRHASVFPARQYQRPGVDSSFMKTPLTALLLLLAVSAALLLAGCASPMRPVSGNQQSLRLTKVVVVERVWGFASLPPGTYSPVAEVGEYMRFSSAGTIPVRSAGINYFWSGGIDLPLEVVRGETSQLHSRLWFVDPSHLISTPTTIEIEQPVAFEFNAPTGANIDSQPSYKNN